MMTSLRSVVQRAAALTSRAASRPSPRSLICSAVHSRMTTEQMGPAMRSQHAPAAAAPGRSHRRLHAASVVCAAAAAQGAGRDRQLRVSHILVKPDQTEAASLVQELRRRIGSGEALADLAKQHSACPSRSKGGDLGWVKRGQMVQEFEEAAWAAPLGQVVSCTSRFGTHLILVSEEKEVAVVQQMTVQELGEILSRLQAEGGSSDDIQLVDVREEREQEMASLPGFQLLPLSRFEAWGPHITQLLDPSKETICLCHHGMRSQQMGNYLIEQGFTNVKNVVGGIDAYSRAVDYRVPQY